MNNSLNGFQPVNCKSGTDYELWVMNMLTILGFDVKLTGGNDNGVDIVAKIKVNGEEIKFYIQCKFYNKPVGRAPVQEVCTGNLYYGNDGHPVVITNNRMTVGALAYAKAVGVEVISQFDFDEFCAVVRNKLAVNDISSHSGLLGIMLGRYLKSDAYICNAIKCYEGKEKLSDKVRNGLREELIGQFDKAEELLRESSELRQMAEIKERQALDLQKKALLRNLDCP